MPETYRCISPGCRTRLPEPPLCECAHELAIHNCPCLQPDSCTGCDEGACMAIITTNPRPTYCPCQGYWPKPTLCEACAEDERKMIAEDFHNDEEYDRSRED